MQVKICEIGGQFYLCTIWFHEFFFKISGALFTSGGLNQLASNGIIHSIEDVIYPYVSDEVATTPKPKFRLREERR